MEFFKQKGPLTKDVCDTLLYVIAVQSLKPATLRDILTASQWNGMWFFSLAFFAVIFIRNAADILFHFVKPHHLKTHQGIQDGHLVFAIDERQSIAETGVGQISIGYTGFVLFFFLHIPLHFPEGKYRT